MIVIHTQNVWRSTRLTMSHVSIVLRSVTTTVNQLNIDVLDILCDALYARDEICFFFFFVSRNSKFLPELCSSSLWQIGLINLCIWRRIILPLDWLKKSKEHPCTGTEALYRPTAHRGNRGIALLFHWPWHYKGGEESASRPGRSLRPGKTRYPLYRRLGGPQGRSGQVRNISPPTGIRSPYRPTLSQSQYGLRYLDRVSFTKIFQHRLIYIFLTFQWQSQPHRQALCITICVTSLTQRTFCTWQRLFFHLFRNTVWTCKQINCLSFYRVSSGLVVLLKIHLCHFISHWYHFFVAVFLCVNFLHFSFMHSSLGENLGMFLGNASM